jgi:hypothetical protein
MGFRAFAKRERRYFFLDLEEPFVLSSGGGDGVIVRKCK